MAQNREYKTNFDIKADSGDGERTFSGYLAYFNNVDSYGDIIEPGAFTETLKSGRTFPVLEQHGEVFLGGGMTPIGYYTDLKEDVRGLFARGKLFSSQTANDVYVALKESPKGFMGQSIGYSVIKSRRATRDEYSRNGVMRFLEQVDLWEGSIVTFPANDKARVDDVKSQALFWRELESELKKQGLSHSLALKAISCFKQNINAGLFAPNEPDTPLEDDELAIKGIDARPILDIFRKFQLDTAQKNIKKEFNNFKL